MRPVQILIAVLAILGLALLAYQAGYWVGAN